MAYDHISFPKDLTEKDKELIILQCEHQHATSDPQIISFAIAYDICKRRMLKGEWFNYPATLLKLIMDFACVIEAKNSTGFRHTPVTFANMERAIESRTISRAMEGFVEAFVECAVPAEDLYKEFELIHPFKDGNGRIGDLLWKMATYRQKGSWPETLPPDVFGKK